MTSMSKKINFREDCTQIQYLWNFVKFFEKTNHIQELKVLLLRKMINKLTNSFIYFYIFFYNITKKLLKLFDLKKLKI